MYLSHTDGRAFLQFEVLWARAMPWHPEMVKVALALGKTGRFQVVVELPLSELAISGGQGTEELLGGGDLMTVESKG